MSQPSRMTLAAMPSSGRYRLLDRVLWSSSDSTSAMSLSRSPCCTMMRPAAAPQRPMATRTRLLVSVLRSMRSPGMSSMVDSAFITLATVVTERESAEMCCLRLRWKKAVLRASSKSSGSSVLSSILSKSRDMGLIDKSMPPCLEAEACRLRKSAFHSASSPAGDGDGASVGAGNMRLPPSVEGVEGECAPCRPCASSWNNALSSSSCTCLSRCVRRSAAFSDWRLSTWDFSSLPFSTRSRILEVDACNTLDNWRLRRSISDSSLSMVRSLALRMACSMSEVFVGEDAISSPSKILEPRLLSNLSIPSIEDIILS
mmetsp:Transcript_6026/g.19476  ORF Transcript_6026/g.19476 Transcript_6026/m.19476 type:complete len:315 (-) Transcript_6026:368-1312(-)